MNVSLNFLALFRSAPCLQKFKSGHELTLFGCETVILTVFFVHASPAAGDILHDRGHFGVRVSRQYLFALLLSKDYVSTGGLFGRDRVRATLLDLLHILVELLLRDGSLVRIFFRVPLFACRQLLIVGIQLSKVVIVARV